MSYQRIVKHGLGRIDIDTVERQIVSPAINRADLEVDVSDVVAGQRTNEIISEPGVTYSTGTTPITGGSIFDQISTIDLRKLATKADGSTIKNVYHQEYVDRMGYEIQNIEKQPSDFVPVDSTTVADIVSPPKAADPAIIGAGMGDGVKAALVMGALFYLFWPQKPERRYRKKRLRKTRKMAKRVSRGMSRV